MNYTELKKCTCGRHNWHQNERCSWCNKKLPSATVDRVMRKLNWFIAICSVIALVSLGTLAYSLVVS